MFIYEMHVRGFTQTADVAHPGTFLGLIEKIPYLKSLGVDAIELLPIFTFNNEKNYWGYGSTDWFSAMYEPGFEALHQAGIKVILDVVYNHTDGKIFPADHYTDQNYSGCGDTLNCNLPEVRKVILDSLHHWAPHVDGFRFDLASVLTRDLDGTPLMPSPLMEEITEQFSNKILIAEPWDAAGLYQRGQFPSPWLEWNDHFRDTVRRFLRGDPGEAQNFADVMADDTSVHFITCHDGFTLRDLVSYNEKHNKANGEENRDGSNHNFSWDCGTALREQQMDNFLLALFASNGVHMLRMGDEYGHTCQGNNNPWCQDNELNWFDWTQKIRPLPQIEEGPIKIETIEEHFVAFTKGDTRIAFNTSNQERHGLAPYSSTSSGVTAGEVL